MPLVALDIAVLPPDQVARRAIEMSARLPRDESQGLLLGADYLPHITLVQLFVDAGELEPLMTAIDYVVRDRPPLHLHVNGGRSGASSVWMGIDPAPALVDVHERLLEATRPFERSGGDATAFFGGDPSTELDSGARDRDVRWVSEYRAVSSGRACQPHITLGHASRPPVIDPFDFTADRIAACHLGRFCSCRRVLRTWMLHQT